MTTSLFKIRFWSDLIGIITVLILSVTACHAQSFISGIPFIRNFYTVDYKAGIQNWDIAQDRRGIIYVANNFGLLEFDGNQWQIHPLKTGTKVRSVAIDKRGRVYVGCQGDFGYFFPNSTGRLIYTSLADSLPKKYRGFDETWSVYVDEEKIYFCTFERIYVYEDGKFSIAQAKNLLNLSFLVNRKLMVTERSGGIDFISDTTLIHIKGSDFFASRSVSTILPLHADDYLVSTFQNGIFKFSNESVVPWNEKMQSFFEEASINCMVRLRNGNFAIGTQNKGLLVLDSYGNILMQLTQGKGLENRTILSLYEDDLNNLWIGHNNGLAYVELGSPFSLINEQSNLPGTGYAAYLDDDHLYLGTNTGLYEKVKSNAENFRLVENTAGQIYHVGRYGKDILIGHHNGAMRLEGTKAKLISNETGAWIYLAPLSQPNKLIGGSYSGLQIYDQENEHWSLKTKLHGFDESSRVMSMEKPGRLWVTHGYKGAYKIEFNSSFDSIDKVSFYGADKGFPTNQLINVFKIRNELLFTGEQGIYKYDEQADAFKYDDLFTSKLGKHVQMWYLQEDALGNIYFIGREHIGVLRKNSIGDYILEADAFNKIRKYLNDDLVNITILKNNEVLFGAKEGFIHYDPKMQVERKPTFKTFIRKVSVTNEGDSTIFYGNYIKNDSIAENQFEDYKLELPYKNNSLNFTFAATSFGDDDLLYQYYLDNYEINWSEWNDKTQKEYTNLKEGQYVFHVRAKNVKGELSPEARYEFTINPPWYRSVWAYSFYGLTAMALMFTAFNLLDRKYQREQKMMELKQKKELNRKENEISQISQQSQEEINKLQNEKLESELQHMNNELATSTMHLLNKNEFISSIKTNLNHIVKKSINEEVKKELHQITKDIENNISNDSDWEQFQFHFDRVHGDFSNRFKIAFPVLSPQEIKLSAYLRMNLSSKEIAHLLNISVRGVEISRYRLRKKLQLERTKNLQDFILNF